MGRLLIQAIERAGLSELAERALVGAGLAAGDLARLRRADLLVVAGLADELRRRHRGDEVRLLSAEAARREPDLVRPSLPALSAAGATGQELLLEVALARLAAPRDRGIAIGFEETGLELAQVALAFGAEALFGDLGSKRTLPLLDGEAARREELKGLIERAGRRVRVVEDARSSAVWSRS